MNYDKIEMGFALTRMSDTLYLFTIDGGSEDERHTFVMDEDSMWALHTAVEHFNHRIMDENMPLNGHAEKVGVFNDNG